jgi:hypothetical protein
MTLHAELLEQDDPAIGDELIRVTHEDGTTEQLRLHDYERLYALPGVYEAIVHDRLGCVSPARLAATLGAAVDGAGWRRADVRVLDVAAGNGVSGEALVAEGLGEGLVGSDIVPSARTAALRDRPNVYDQYLTLDLLALTAEQRRAIVQLRATALSCVAPVGDADSQVPPAALLAAAALLSDDAFVVYMHDPSYDVPDVITAERFAEVAGLAAQEVARERYVHRRTVNGEPFEMVGVVWRLRRAARDGQAQ